jgi:hypothetical protein
VAGLWTHHQLTRSWPDASTKETINTWRVSSLEAIPKNIQSINPSQGQEMFLTPLKIEENGHLHTSKTKRRVSLEDLPMQSI